MEVSHLKKVSFSFGGKNSKPASLRFRVVWAWYVLIRQFFGLNGESSAGGYQDCGPSSMLLMGEPPWCTGSTPSSIREPNLQHINTQGRVASECPRIVRVE
ncbi:Zinc finger protein CONSTANS-LIKE 9-like [Forsythia ovata]|uniref:Zinc finger protein CONSTANS-LIKE 9-like n=1 Tax=Forsythia ovata TaxID=205694 RepID=A0ABD1X8A9_9LAMI